MRRTVRGAWRWAVLLLAVAAASLLLLAVLHPAHAQGYPITGVFVLGTGGNCVTTSCTSGTKVLCRNSGTSTTAYACNSSTFKFDIPLSAAVAGANQQVQFNSGGAFAGDAGLVFNPGNDQLTVAGLVAASGLTSSSGASIGGALTVTSGGLDVTGPSSITGGDLSLATGQKLILTGAGGTTYLVWDAASRQVRVYANGSLRARITANGVIPGPCPSDPWAMEGGTECYDQATGKRMTLDARGLHDVGR